MKRLFINIPKIVNTDFSKEDVECEYFYHRGNDGALSLFEIAQFATFCRQCEEAFCIEACPKDALEHKKDANGNKNDGEIIRHNIRCIGCKSCSLACPFGTIFPEVVNNISPKCDYCLQHLEGDNEDTKCVKSSPKNVIEVVDLDEERPDDDIFFAQERLAIKSYNWRWKENKV